jgi:hypothetical protein
MPAGRLFAPQVVSVNRKEGVPLVSFIPFRSSHPNNRREFEAANHGAGFNPTGGIVKFVLIPWAFNEAGVFAFRLFGFGRHGLYV